MKTLIGALCLWMLAPIGQDRTRLLLKSKHLEFNIFIVSSCVSVIAIRYPCSWL